MAASNTAFKVDHGLLVIGTANVQGNALVTGTLTVEGNIAFSGTQTADIKPGEDNTYALGNTTNRWVVHATTVNGVDAVFTANGVFGNAVVANTVIPNANNLALGSTTRLWNLNANVVNGVTLNITGAANVGNAGVANLQIDGAKIRIESTAGANVDIANTLTFDYDLLSMDAVNNRLGIKVLPSSINANGVLTVNGSVVFVTNATGLKFFNSANGSVNSFVSYSGNGNTALLNINVTDNSNSTALANGGLLVTGSNTTVTSNLLFVSKSTIQYKDANVAHAGNFGIYDVTGTRVGP